MQPQARIRKMRRPGRKHGRSADGICEVYHDPDIRAARRARDRELGLAGTGSR